MSVLKTIIDAVLYIFTIPFEIWGFKLNFLSVFVMAVIFSLVSYFIFTAKIRVYFLTSEPTIKKNKKKYNFLDLC